MLLKQGDKRRVEQRHGDTAQRHPDKIEKKGQRQSHQYGKSAAQDTAQPDGMDFVLESAPGRNQYTSQDVAHKEYDFIECQIQRLISEGACDHKRGQNRERGDQDISERHIGKQTGDQLVIFGVEESLPNCAEVVHLSGFFSVFGYLDEREDRDADNCRDDVDEENISELDVCKQCTACRGGEDEHDRLNRRVDTIDAHKLLFRNDLGNEGRGGRGLDTAAKGADDQNKKQQPDRLVSGKEQDCDNQCGKCNCSVRQNNQHFFAVFVRPYARKQGDQHLGNESAQRRQRRHDA